VNRSFLPALWLASVGIFATSVSAGVLREEGAIYLEDTLTKPVRLAVLDDATIYFNASLDRYLGVLKKGQVVEVLAVKDRVYRVRGRAQQGQVAGWVENRHLEKLDDKFLADLKANADRQAEVQVLIANNEVAINMTTEEVKASLGKPGKKTARLDATGREEIWEYVRYERVPQQTVGRDWWGRLVANNVYVKVPVGQLSVTFKDDLVTAVEQTEGTLLKQARVRIVTAPLEVY
jgi:hypothetical protein